MMPYELSNDAGTLLLELDELLNENDLFDGIFLVGDSFIMFIWWLKRTGDWVFAADAL
jgi:hypothetical protein